MVLKVFCRTMSADNRVCAERFIRPLAGERKNSLFFGSDKMAGVSAVYHTIIFTCRMQGVSVLDYFKRFFSEIVKDVGIMNICYLDNRTGAITNIKNQYLF